MPEEVLALAGVLAALAVGVVSPGPSFVMIARVAVAHSRSQALAAALGMGIGGMLFGLAALLGLQSVFQAVPAFYLALKVLGGLYLCYLGIAIFRSAALPLSVAASTPGSGTSLRSLGLGLTTQVSNPKTAIVYASVFAAFLPQHVSFGFGALLLAMVFLIEAGWYSLVAVVLSASAPQRAYLSFKAWIDRAAGLVMFGLGIKLAASATRP